MQGSYAPCQRILYGFLLFLITLNQCEMGAKKIKRQDFLIEVSAFFIIFYFLTGTNYFF
jgi:hypothetical protein